MFEALCVSCLLPSKHRMARISAAGVAQGQLSGTSDMMEDAESTSYSAVAGWGRWGWLCHGDRSPARTCAGGDVLPLEPHGGAHPAPLLGGDYFASVGHSSFVTCPVRAVVEQPLHCAVTGPTSSLHHSSQLSFLAGLRWS